MIINQFQYEKVLHYSTQVKHTNDSILNIFQSNHVAVDKERDASVEEQQLVSDQADVRGSL